MPDSRNSDLGSYVCNKTDELEEWRGKHHLLKKDYEVYQQRCEEKKKENKERIQLLRQENANLRLHLGRLKNGDESVIQSAFKNDYKGRLQLQRNFAQDAIKTMDQKVCEGMKQLNRLKYERKKKECQLNELGMESDQLVESMDNSPYNATEETIGKLENSLDKVQIKLSTAQSITDRLEEITEKLREDALKMPAKLDAMELSFLDHMAEMERLREVSAAANVQKDNTKRELMRVEQHVYETRKKREMELAQMKNEVARRKTEADKVEKRYQRTNLLNEGQEQKLLEEQEAVTKRQQDILKYEDALQRIMDSSSVANINNVASHYKMQVERKEKMKIQLDNLQKLSTNLKDERDHLNEQFRKMKYSGDGAISYGQMDLDGLSAMIAEEKSKMAEASLELERNGKVLNDVTQAVGALLHMFDTVKLSPPEHNFKTGDVFTQLDTCSKKGNMLMKQLHLKTEDPNVLSSLPPEQFNQFVDKQLTLDNVRIKLDKKESSMSGYSDFDYEGQEGGEQAPSRLEIKTIAQKLVAQKMGKKKRKEKSN